MRMNLKSSACAAAAATAALCLSSVTDFDPFHTDLLSAHAGGAPAFAGKGKGKDGKDVADDAKDKGKGKRKDKGEDKDEVAGNDDDFIGNDNGGNDAMGSSDDADIASTDAAQPDVTRDSDQWERVRRRQTPTQTDGDI